MYKKLIDCVIIGKRSEAAKLLFQWILLLNWVKHSFACEYRYGNFWIVWIGYSVSKNLFKINNEGTRPMLVEFFFSKVEGQDLFVPNL